MCPVSNGVDGKYVARGEAHGSPCRVLTILLISSGRFDPLRSAACALPVRGSSKNGGVSIAIAGVRIERSHVRAVLGPARSGYKVAALFQKGSRQLLLSSPLDCLPQRSSFAQGILHGAVASLYKHKYTHPSARTQNTTLHIATQAPLCACPRSDRDVLRVVASLQ